MIPYWLSQSLIVLPLVLWIYFGLGIPYALLALPRTAWARKAEVLALAFAFGATLLTIWSFVLGTIGGAYEIALLRFDLLLGGTIVLALLGIGLVWRKMKQTKAEISAKIHLAFDEKLLIALLTLLMLLITVATMYWPFTAYDTLWVYGYEGRLYTHLGYIPQHIGYYPQFLPLQYSFLQLAVGGYDDHAARMIVPFLYLGSILAAYSMGERLFSRRVGFFTAAIWAFYPHAAQWAQVGDLEIPLTFLFTLTASYFLQAWTESETWLRRRYALIAGLCFGIAMWTKPTAGAFVYGVILLVAIHFLAVFLARYSRANSYIPISYTDWYPRFEVAMITALACIPFGSIWYLRNALLGLEILVFPNKNWLSLATRSGDLLSWPLLALFLLLAFLSSTRKLQNSWMLFLGTILILAGAMPSSPLIDLSRRDAPMSYIQWYEALSIILGLSLIGWNLRKCPFPSKIAWAYLLALPYFVTWFWSYSYHARLSFAIVPLLILPSAVLIAKIKIPWKIPWALLILILSVYGLAMPIFGIAPYHDWLWVERYPDDEAKYNVHNGDVYQTALFIFGYERVWEQEPIIIAPGEQRLGFFFPHLQIITDTIPTRYEDLEGATFFIYGSLARWRYEDEGIAPEDNRVVASLGRQELFSQIYDFEDGNFEYELYELHLDRRFHLPDGGPAGHQIADRVVFNNSIAYIGDSVGNTQLAGNRIFLSFLWQATAIPEGDYFLRLSLLYLPENEIKAVWDFRFLINEDSEYSTVFWEPGEYIITRHEIFLENLRGYPRAADAYRILVNLVDTQTGQLLPLTINAEEAEAYSLEALFSIGR